jgi:hypothetical protein
MTNILHVRCRRIIEVPVAFVICSFTRTNTAYRQSSSHFRDNCAHTYSTSVHRGSVDHRQCSQSFKHIFVLTEVDRRMHLRRHVALTRSYDAYFLTISCCSTSTDLRFTSRIESIDERQLYSVSYWFHMSKSEIEQESNNGYCSSMKCRIDLTREQWTNWTIRWLLLKSSSTVDINEENRDNWIHRIDSSKPHDMHFNLVSSDEYARQNYSTHQCYHCAGILFIFTHPFQCYGNMCMTMVTIEIVLDDNMFVHSWLFIQVLHEHHGLFSFNGIKTNDSVNDINCMNKRRSVRACTIRYNG